MELMLNGRNIEITTRLRNYVEKKTARLDRYMPNLREVRVDLSSENTRSSVERHIAQITVQDTKGTILRAEERSNDIFASVDASVSKLYRQIKRYRGKRQRKWRSGGQTEEFLGEPLPFEDEDLLEEDEEMSIVRYKRFPMHPMSPQEAIDQLELLGHDFFVFFNSEDDMVNVLYKRRDNSYGLLQPEMD